jgi:hypothetical protein
MYILKTETNDFYRKIFWTLDGVHIFRVQQIPLNRPKKGNHNQAKHKSF